MDCFSSQPPSLAARGPQRKAPIPCLRALGFWPPLPSLSSAHCTRPPPRVSALKEHHISPLMFAWNTLPPSPYSFLREAHLPYHSTSPAVRRSFCLRVCLSYYTRTQSLRLCAVSTGPGTGLGTDSLSGAKKAACPLSVLSVRKFCHLLSAFLLPKHPVSRPPFRSIRVGRGRGRCRCVVGPHVAPGGAAFLAVGGAHLSVGALAG